MTSIRLAAALAMGVATFAAPAAAQNYPTQPVRIIVPTPPGGVADLLARIIAQSITETGKTVIAEQRTGGGGVIAADFVAKSAPDGYTIYMGFHPTQSILVHLQKLPYDPAKDFAPIILVGSSPNIAGRASLAAGEDAEGAGRIRAQQSGEDLVRFARQRLIGPHGRRAVQASCTSSIIVHVPYKGAGPAVIDLVAGHIQMMFDIVPVAQRAHRWRASSARSG